MKVGKRIIKYSYILRKHHIFILLMEMNIKLLVFYTILVLYSIFKNIFKTNYKFQNTLF